MSITIDNNVDTASLPDRIKRFPFPYSADQYRYAANVEPARKENETEAGSWGSTIVDVDEHYADDLKLRAQILERDPSRIAVLPHMRPAVWDAILFLLPEMASDNPTVMSWERDGDKVHWRNDLLNMDIEFTLGDDESLPTSPLDFLGSQIQDDIVFLEQRDKALWLDAGVVTFAADWSIGFDVGMNFTEIHSPVPRVNEEKIVSRAQHFLMSLQPGESYRRTNWSMTIDRRLDVSTETYLDWAADRGTISSDPALPQRVNLRVEVQQLIRLPRSGSILFLIRTYLLPLEDVAKVPAWRERMARVLAELPDDMADYKGVIRYKDAASAWLLSDAAR